MKKVITIFGAIILASLTITSCGGKSSNENQSSKETEESLKVEPSSASIDGPLSEYLSIVQIPYQVDEPFNVKIKCLKQMDEELVNSHSFTLNIIFKDKNGMPIKNGELSSNSSRDIRELLIQEGADKVIELSNYSFDVNESGSEISSFSISSTMTLEPKNIEIKLGETGSTNFVEFKVINVRDYNGGYYPNHEDNEKYIAVQVQLANVSNEPIEFDLDNIILTDQEGADYQEQGYFTDQRKKPVLFGKENHMMPKFTLDPGAKASGWVTFTTDQNSNPKQIRLNTSSYGDVIVNL